MNRSEDYYHATIFIGIASCFLDQCSYNDIIYYDNNIQSISVMIKVRVEINSMGFFSQWKRVSKRADTVVSSVLKPKSDFVLYGRLYLGCTF